MINLCKHLYGQKKGYFKRFFQEIPLIRINIFALKTTSDFFLYAYCIVQNEPTLVV